MELDFSAKLEVAPTRIERFENLKKKKLKTNGNKYLCHSEPEF